MLLIGAAALAAAAHFILVFPAETAGRAVHIPIGPGPAPAASEARPDGPAAIAPLENRDLRVPAPDPVHGPEVPPRPEPRPGTERAFLQVFLAARDAGPGALLAAARRAVGGTGPLAEKAAALRAAIEHGGAPGVAFAGEILADASGPEPLRGLAFRLVAARAPADADARKVLWVFLGAALPGDRFRPAALAPALRWAGTEELLRARPVLFAAEDPGLFGLAAAALAASGDPEAGRLLRDLRGGHPSGAVRERLARSSDPGP